MIQGPEAVFTTLYYLRNLTYESAQQARLFHNTKLERLTSDKHSNLSGQFVSYKENEVL